MSERLRVKSVNTFQSETITMSFEPCGWLVVTFCEERGSIQIQSDWGNAAFIWLHTGVEGQDKVKRFFAYAGVDYILNKFSYDQPNLKDVIDADKTQREVKYYILERRREGWIEKDEAREAWDDIELYQDELEGFDGHVNMGDCRWYDAMSSHIDDLYEFIYTRPSPMYISYRDIVVPTIQRWLVDQGYKR